MKSFFQFFRESTAVQQATRMGLQSDGHGGWYDKDGEFGAKTKKGPLKFFNKSKKEAIAFKDVSVFEAIQQKKVEVGTVSTSGNTTTGGSTITNGSTGGY